MLNKPFSMTIDGQSVTCSEMYGIENPATEEVFAHAPNCTKDQLDLAVSSANAAFVGWRQTPYKERQQKLNEFAAILVEQSEALAPLLTKEQGKKVEDSVLDILGGAQWIQETAKYELPETISEDSEERVVITRHHPIGVVGALVPWNYPVMLAMQKVAPALLAGNTVVLKPSPTTPLTTLRIGEIANKIFPAGVLNVISGDDRLGPWLTEHSGVDKISFTGSTQTGRNVMRSAASTLKPVTLELGGNDACIVMPSVNPSEIAPYLFWSAFTNSGQVCIATKRLYVHSEVYDEVKRAIADFASSVVIGNGLEKTTQIGPIQNRIQYERVKAIVEDCELQNYNFVFRGDLPNKKGFFVPIYIVDNPPESSRIVQDEQFGPILPMLKFDNTEDLIRRVNDSEYGLSALIWSADVDEAESIANRLDVGSVWINEGQHISPNASFGGHKQSGIGVEGGIHGLLAYTRAKTVYKAKSNPSSLI